MSKVYTSISEIYDLHTQVGKLGLIGIKTPAMRAIANAYKGLLFNFQKVKFLSCDVSMACASPMAVDPLQVGFEAGSQLDPRSIFDPILYTAVSNDTMGAIISKIHQSDDIYTALSGDSVSYHDNVNTIPSLEGDPLTFDPFKIYYNLLANGRFRKAMPQMGMHMSGLKPLVFPLATSVKIAPTLRPAIGGAPTAYPTEQDADGASMGVNPRVATFGLHPVEMPSLETAIWQTAEQFRYPTEFLGSPDSYDRVDNAVTGNVNYSDPKYAPPVYVGAIITPPARSEGSRLYYRMTVTWHIVFSELRPFSEVQSLEGLTQATGTMYYTDYGEQSATMTASGDMVDTTNTELEPVMVKVV